MVAERQIEDVPYVPYIIDRPLTDQEMFGHLYPSPAEHNGAVRAVATPSNGADVIPIYRKRQRWQPKPDTTAERRQRVYAQRLTTLRSVLEWALIGCGMDCYDAQNAVTKWVSTSRGRASAKAVAARWGYDYLKAEWV